MIEPHLNTTNDPLVYRHRRGELTYLHELLFIADVVVREQKKENLRVTLVQRAD
jgi:hypothetical protein